VWNVRNSFKWIYDPELHHLFGFRTVLVVIIDDVIVASFAGVNIIAAPIVDDVVHIIHQFGRTVPDSVESRRTAIAMRKKIMMCRQMLSAPYRTIAMVLIIFIACFKMI